MKKYRVLLVDDDVDFATLFKEALAEKNYQVDLSHDGPDAIDKIQSEDYDLFIVDKILPNIGGIEICSFIRKYKKTRYLPVIILTAISEVQSEIEGLSIGADDYIVKPCDINLCVARIEALLRRFSFSQSSDAHTSSSILIFDQIKIDTDQCKVWVNDKEISLTVSEYKILNYLIVHAFKVISRNKLIEVIKGDNVFITERTIDTHIFGLRKKLGAASNNIETIRGIGYKATRD